MTPTKAFAFMPSRGTVLLLNGIAVAEVTNINFGKDYLEVTANYIPADPGQAELVNEETTNDIVILCGDEARTRLEFTFTAKDWLVDFPVADVVTLYATFYNEAADVTDDGPEVEAINAVNAAVVLENSHTYHYTPEPFAKAGNALKTFFDMVENAADSLRVVEPTNVPLPAGGGFTQVHSENSEPVCQCVEHNSHGEWTDASNCEIHRAQADSANSRY